MYARLIQLCFKQTVSHDQAHALYQELINECRRIDGFRGYSFMLMPSSRRGLTLTFWDDATCASAGGEQVLPTIIERMGDLLSEAPEITGYEVVDHVMIHPDAP